MRTVGFNDSYICLKKKREEGVIFPWALLICLVLCSALLTTTAMYKNQLSNTEMTKRALTSQYLVQSTQSILNDALVSTPDRESTYTFVRQLPEGEIKSVCTKDQIGGWICNWTISLSDESVKSVVTYQDPSK